MPVSLVPSRPDPDSTVPVSVRNGRQESRSGLVIGLLNNMPDGALEATERQFLSLLNAASQELPVHLVLLTLPGIPRGEAAAAHVHRHYVCVESLFDTHLDGLIVTGREPLSPRLSDEPWWDSFVRVLEWAREKTSSTVWSCLAAHAAVLHLNGIERVRSRQKYCGVFECARTSNHSIVADLPPLFRMPHSRWNGLPEADLVRSGYEILARAGDAGVDSFLRRERSLFLFFQGHPEYEPDTLLLEYRRDVLRFLRGEAQSWPGTPRGYFDGTALRELAALQRDAAAAPEEQTVAQLARLFSKLPRENGWHSTAVTLYRNWLEYIESASLASDHRKEAAAAEIPVDILEVMKQKRSGATAP